MRYAFLVNALCIPRVVYRIHHPPPEKKTGLDLSFFQLNPPAAEEIHLQWMKSLRDEICLSAEDRGGFYFI